MEANPGPLLLLHPDGALGTARSGMVLAEVAPAVQAEAEALKAELQELAELRQCSFRRVTRWRVDWRRHRPCARNCRRRYQTAPICRSGLPKTPMHCGCFWKVPTRWMPLRPDLPPSVDETSGFAEAKGSAAPAGAGHRAARTGRGRCRRHPPPGVTLSTQAGALVTAPLACDDPVSGTPA